MRVELKRLSGRHALREFDSYGYLREVPAQALGLKLQLREQPAAWRDGAHRQRGKLARLEAGRRRHRSGKLAWLEAGCRRSRRRAERGGNEETDEHGRGGEADGHGD